MKIRCDRADLVDRLNTIVGIIPPNTPKPILGDFYLASRDGSLVAEATDLSLSGKVFVRKVEVLEEGKLALPSSRLLAILKEIPEDAVNLVGLSDGAGAEIQSRGFEFKILGHDPVEFPSGKEFESTATVVLKRDGLYESLRRVSVAASRDTTRYQLNGVFVEIDKGKMQLTATDGKRLTHDQLRLESDDGLKISAIVPNQAVDVFLRALASHAVQDEHVSLSFSENRAALVTRDMEISSSLVEGMYPSYQSVFGPETKVRARARRADLLTAAKSSALTTDKLTHTVVFRANRDSLILKSNAKDIGESKIEVPLELDGDPIEVKLNPIYFIDALRTFDQEELSLEFSAPDKPVLLKGSQNYVHYLVPLVAK